MKIGVDAGVLGGMVKQTRLGVFQMSFNLLKQLARIDRQNEYRLYSFLPIEKSILYHFGPRMKNFVVRPRRGWRYLALPLKLMTAKNDVFLGLSQALPKKVFCPSVAIIHDLGFERFPNFYPTKKKLNCLTRQAASQAKQLIAVSKSTKKDLQTFFNVPDEKITVAYEGCDQQIFRPDLRKRKKDYFLYVGGFKKSKNIFGLLKAMRVFLNKSGLDFHLKMVGGSQISETIKPVIKKLQLTKQIKIYHYLSPRRLARLYQEATALVSPAFWEGFGLPLLEALNCGCPVIAGKSGAVPEVVGQAGLLVNPFDYQAIGQTMFIVATNKKKQKKMIKAGLKKAEEFSWKKFSIQVFAALKAVKENEKD